MHCPMSATDPPVEILLADGWHVGWIHPMEEEPLIQPCPELLFFHVLFCLEKIYLVYAYNMHKHFFLCISCLHHPNHAQIQIIWRIEQKML